MNDDTLLKGAARAAGEAARRDPLSPEWDRVSADNLSDEERESLRERCPDERLAERAEVAFRPLQREDRAQFVAAAMAARKRAGGVEPADGEVGGESGHMARDMVGDMAGDVAGRETNVVQLTRRTPRAAWAFGLAASAVLAVGVVMSANLFAPGDSGALPEFGYELRGTAEVRSATSRSVRIDQSFELLLTPQTALTSAAQVRLYVDNGQALLPVELTTLDVAASGAARLIAPAASLPLGDVELVAVVSRGQWPDREALSESSDDWQAVRVSLTVVPATRN